MSENRYPDRLPSPEDRERLRAYIAEKVDLPLSVLGFVLLLIIIVDFVIPLTPQGRDLLAAAAFIIWVAFLTDFVLELLISPSKRRFLAEHWLVAISVALPFFRFLRFLRFAPLVRPLALSHLLASVSRTLHELSEALRGKQFIYLMATAFIAWLSGAAGLYYFEHDLPTSPIRSFGESSWYVLTVLTTIGGERNPVTIEGRIIAFILMVFGVAIFSYVIAAVSSHFVDEDITGRRRRREIPNLSHLTDEVRELRNAVAALLAQNEQLRRK